MKRIFLTTGLVLSVMVAVGCRDKASTFDDDTPAATGSQNVDTYGDVKTETKSEARELKDDADRTENRISNELKQWKEDVDEEFKDSNEPGDRYGKEMDSVKGGEKGSTEPVEKDAKDKSREIKNDADEEFHDTNEPGDKAGGETDTYKGGAR